MYIWNGIKINIDGNKKKFISIIHKYLHASYSESKDMDYDIDISVYGVNENMMPPVNRNAKLKKTFTLAIEKEYISKIYSFREELWYLYQDLASYWIDLRNNKIVISIHDESFSFQYYNILIFLLYPLGLLFENFGFYRIHSSCVNIAEKAVLITGRSGSGKSTSAFALALNGGDIVSDDLTFIKKTGDDYYTYTMTRLVKLHDFTINRFYPELLNHGSLKNDEGEVYFDEGDINSRTIGSPVLDSIIILEKIDNRNSSFKRVHPSRVIPHLFPSSIQLSNERFTHNKFLFLTEMLNDIPCYEVRFGTDMKDFYRNITNILKNGNKG